jgi:hypothetical protein
MASGHKSMKKSRPFPTRKNHRIIFDMKKSALGTMVSALAKSASGAIFFYLVLQAMRGRRAAKIESTCVKSPNPTPCAS